MSKRTRNSDNSKRPQPIQQQRAQARQPGSTGPAKAEKSQQRSGQDKDDGGDNKQR